MNCVVIFALIFILCDRVNSISFDVNGNVLLDAPSSSVNFQSTLNLQTSNVTYSDVKSTVQTLRTNLRKAQHLELFNLNSFPYQQMSDVQVSIPSPFFNANNKSYFIAAGNMAKIFAYDSLSATWAAVPSALNTSEYLAGWWTFERNGSLYATYSGDFSSTLYKWNSTTFVPNSVLSSDPFVDGATAWYSYCDVNGGYLLQSNSQNGVVLVNKNGNWVKNFTTPDNTVQMQCFSYNNANYMAVIAQNSTNLPYLSVYRIDNYPFTLIAKIDSVKANFDVFTSGNYAYIVVAYPSSSKGVVVHRFDGTSLVTTSTNTPVEVGFTTQTVVFTIDTTVYCAVATTTSGALLKWNDKVADFDFVSVIQPNDYPTLVTSTSSVLTVSHGVVDGKHWLFAGTNLPTGSMHFYQLI